MGAFRSGCPSNPKVLGATGVDWKVGGAKRPASWPDLIPADRWTDSESNHVRTSETAFAFCAATNGLNSPFKFAPATPLIIKTFAALPRFKSGYNYANGCQLPLFPSPVKKLQQKETRQPGNFVRIDEFHTENNFTCALCMKKKRKKQPLGPMNPKSKPRAIKEKTR